MATITCSLAQAAAPTVNVHTGSVLHGTVSGDSSLSGSQRILLCKIPPNSEVTIIEYHSSGETTQTLNFGFRQGNSTSASISAMGSGVLNQTNVLTGTTTWDQTAGETFKYVVADLEAGTASASIEVRFTVFVKPL